MDEYQPWKDKIINTYESEIDSLSKDKNELTNIIEKLNSRLDKEIRLGGTEVVVSGRKVITKPGDGPIADEVRRKITENEKKLIISSENLESVKTEFDGVLVKLSKYESDAVQVDNLTKIEILCTKSFGSESAEICSISNKEFFKKAQKYRNAIQLYDHQCSSDIINGKSQTESLNIVRKCVFQSNLPEAEVEHILRRVGSLNKNYGDQAHKMIYSINELGSLNTLAVGAMIIAVVVDTLVLLCAFIGARHESFLNIKTASDLSSMQNYPLEIVMSASIEPNANDKAMIKRIKEILSALEYDVEFSEQGFGGILHSNKISNLSLHKELGVFLSMNLAKPLNNGSVIGFRTRFILWMCEQAYRGDMSKSVFRDMEKDLAEALSSRG